MQSLNFKSRPLRPPVFAFTRHEQLRSWLQQGLCTLHQLAELLKIQRTITVSARYMIQL